MKKVVLLLLVVILSMANVYAQKSEDEYFGDMTNMIFLRSPRAQIIREIEKYLTTQKKARISDITIEIDTNDRITKGWYYIDFTLTPTQKAYNFDCFPLPKYGEDGKDNDWVKVSLDTSKFVLKHQCSITLNDFQKDGYTYTAVRIHFSAYTESIETHSTKFKEVSCRFTDLTSDLKAYLASKFKTK